MSKERFLIKQIIIFKLPFGACWTLIGLRHLVPELRTFGACDPPAPSWRTGPNCAAHAIGTDARGTDAKTKRPKAGRRRGRRLEGAPFYKGKILKCINRLAVVRRNPRDSGKKTFHPKRIN
jgi:hypothetical protein